MKAARESALMSVQKSSDVEPPCTGAGFSASNPGEETAASWKFLASIRTFRFIERPGRAKATVGTWSRSATPYLNTDDVLFAASYGKPYPRVGRPREST